MKKPTPKGNPDRMMSAKEKEAGRKKAIASKPINSIARIRESQRDAYANLYGPASVSDKPMKLDGSTGRYVPDNTKPRMSYRDRRANNKALQESRDDARRVAKDPKVQAKRKVARAAAQLAVKPAKKGK